MTGFETSHTESFEARYDLPSDEVGQITRDFLRERDIPRGRYYCTVITNETGPIANVARSVEGAVFDEEFDNDSETMATSYAPYENVSRFYSVFDTKAGKLVGVLRVIENSDAGIPTLNDTVDQVEGITWDNLHDEHGIEKQELDDVWDVGTLALLPEYRGGTSGAGPSALLYRAFVIDALERNVESMVATIDAKALKALRKLGIPLGPICDSDSFEYKGSEESFAVVGKIDTLIGGVDRRAKELRKEAFARFPRSPESALRRFMVSHVAGKIATGRGLDTHTHL